MEAGAERGLSISIEVLHSLNTSISLDIIGRLLLLVFGDQVRSKSEADCVARRLGSGWVKSLASATIFGVVGSLADTNPFTLSISSKQSEDRHLRTSREVVGLISRTRVDISEVSVLWISAVLYWQYFTTVSFSRG